MQITAKLVQVLPAQTGQGKNGEWRKQEIIVETDGQYPRKICISVWGDKLGGLKLSPGTELSIDFDIESREYNGRWYTDVKAWRVTESDVPGETGSPASKGKGSPASSSFPPASDAPPQFEDDLPF